MEKTTLPIKTKIAAWWMIVVLSIPSLILGCGAIVQLVDFLDEHLGYVFLAMFGCGVFGGISFIMSLFGGIFLLKRKRLAWKFSIGILSIYLLGILVGGMLGRPLTGEWAGDWREVILWFILFGLYLATFILLLLDRKNFWEIAS